MSFQITNGRFHADLANGVPLAAGRLYTYVSGTTTFKTTYTDGTLATPNTYTNDGSGGLYIALDARGEAQVWLGTGPYTLTLKDSAGVTVWTVDNIIDPAGATATLQTNLSANSGSALVGFIQSGAGAVARNAQDKMRDVFNAKDFGAVGDGVADDTTKLQAACDAAAAAGRRLVAAGTFKTTAKLTIKGDADFSQATLQVYGTPAVALEVSTGNATNPTTNLQHCVVALPKLVQNMTKPGTGWAGQAVGIRCVNLYACEVHVGDAQGFATGLLVTSFGGNGNGYNTYHIGHLDNNAINLDLNPGDTTSWVNENLFVGGRYSHLTAEGSNIAGTRHIRLAKATLYVNNNVFVKPSVEGDVPEYHIECGGSFTTFDSARFDSTRPNVLYTADNSSQAVNNVFRGGYAIDTVTYTYTVTGGGKQNRTFGFFQDLVSIGSSTGNRYRNTASSQNPIHAFYEANVIPETASASQWCVQHGPYKLLGKKSTDAFSRVWHDYQNGRIYFDNGTTDDVSKTAYIGNQGANAIGINSSVYPAVDNTYAFGSTGLRWSTLYATTGTINTSDAREKQGIRALSAQEKAVGVALKGLVKSFLWTASVQAKGSDARIHVGWIAQEVIAAFQAQGLDPFAYGVCCYDQWPASYDESGHLITPAGDRYGVRHDELIAFILGAM